MLDGWDPTKAQPISSARLSDGERFSIERGSGGTYLFRYGRAAMYRWKDRRLVCAPAEGRSAARLDCGLADLAARSAGFRAVLGQPAARVRGAARNRGRAARGCGRVHRTAGRGQERPGGGIPAARRRAGVRRGAGAAPGRWDREGAPGPPAPDPRAAGRQPRRPDVDRGDHRDIRERGLGGRPPGCGNVCSVARSVPAGTGGGATDRASQGAREPAHAAAPRPGHRRSARPSPASASLSTASSPGACRSTASALLSTPRPPSLPMQSRRGSPDHSPARRAASDSTRGPLMVEMGERAGNLP